MNKCKLCRNKVLYNKKKTLTHYLNKNKNIYIHKQINILKNLKSTTAHLYLCANFIHS